MENDNNNNNKFCRICFEDYSYFNNKLFSPCLCRGTQSFVHEKCLNLWRNSNNFQHYYECSICKYKYRIARVYYTQYIKDPIFISFLTILFISILLLFICLVIKTISYWFFGLVLGFRNIFSMTTKIIYYLLLIVGIFVLILAVFENNNNNNNPFGELLFEFIIRVQNSVIFDCFSLIGLFSVFSLFYDYVENIIIKKILDKIQDKILDINL